MQALRRSFGQLIIRYWFWTKFKAVPWPRRVGFFAHPQYNGIKQNIIAVAKASVGLLAGIVIVGLDSLGTFIVTWHCGRNRSGRRVWLMQPR